MKPGQAADPRTAARKTAQASLLAQFVSGAGGASAHFFSAATANSVHVDYYTAVAAITPALLIAGFVELALLGKSTGAWGVVTFAVPVVGATTAALLALATHDSTPATLYLTIWGLLATMVSLMLLIVVHTQI